MHPENKNQKYQILLLLAKIVYFVFPLIVTWISLSLMSIHLEYYDIGVNMTANSFYLLLVVFPALLLTLYIIAAVNIFLTKRFFKSEWLRLCIGVILVILAGIGAFAIHDHNLANYPTEKPKNMVLFLEYYFDEIRK